MQVFILTCTFTIVYLDLFQNTEYNNVKMHLYKPRGGQGMHCNLVIHEIKYGENDSYVHWQIKQCDIN